jgi:hypothetical protein
MLPKLVWNAGVAAVAAGATMFALESFSPATRMTHNPYTLTVSRNTSGHLVVSGKPPGNPALFKLDYYGVVSFEIVNDTNERIDFRMSDFTKSGPRDCPLEFLAHGNSQLCFANTVLRDRGDSKVIFAMRGDTDPDRTERFKFNVKVNGDIIDPEIEIDRDPSSFNLKYLLWLLLSGGAVSMFVGWWLLRKG